MTFERRLRDVLQLRLVRFGGVGAAGMVVDEGVLAIAHFIVGLDPYVARAISIFCAMTFTWWGNRTFTFADHAADVARDILAEWLKFIAANSIGAAANFATYTLLVAVAPQPVANPLIATPIGVLVGLVFNFTLSSRFVFRAR